jgi:geranylgeranyl diphosphate/geranylgeranyl-bacteriochlorophyllide a reductase
MSMDQFDVVVVGGGPAGATAAHEMAKTGRKTLLLDRAWRIKPCGGAVPPQLLKDFDDPEDLLVARIDTARMISPKENKVDIPVGEGFVGMVDRDVFDEWLRQRAESAGAERRTGAFVKIERDDDGLPILTYTEGRSRHGVVQQVKAKMVIGCRRGPVGGRAQRDPGARIA